MMQARMTEWLCPECYRRGSDVLLFVDADCIYECRSCGGLYENDELGRVYNSMLTALHERIADLEGSQMAPAPIAPPVGHRV